MKHFLQVFAVMVLALVSSTALFAEVTVKMTSPTDGSVLSPCIDLDLSAEVTASEPDTILDVRFYYNDRQRYRDRKEPWEYTWKGIDRGVYHFYVKATTTAGIEYFSDPVRVKIGQISFGEKLFNGGFDCGRATNWTTQTSGGTSADASFTVFDDTWFDDAYYMFVDIIDGGTENWHVQMSTLCPTDSGHVYEITFLADAEDAKSIDVAMQENQDPWATQQNFAVEIDGPDLYGPLDFIASKTDPTNQLRFNVGLNKIPFYLDEVQVIDRSMSGVSAKRISFSGAIADEFELNQAYPNPFNMTTNIRYTLSRDADVSLEVFDMQGRKVTTLHNGHSASGAHTARWNGRTASGFDAASGVYICRMSVQDDAVPVLLTQKLLLIK